MAVAGVIAEYNPFHGGHLHHLRTVRSRLGEDTPVVVTLSGDFVQRGEAAVFSKFARAEAAVRCGASLVLELPLPWCLSSAEGFARGGIGLLAATGVVDTISFGSESGDAEALRRCAEVMDTEGFRRALRENLERGVSFAAAREKAAAGLLGKEAELLRSPNDLLGVEYIRAAKMLGADMSFLTVKRDGSAHDGPGSAKELREMMSALRDWLRYVPDNAAQVYLKEIREGRGPVGPDSLRQGLMSRLRMLTEEELALLPDASEGLDHRLYRAIQKASSPEEAAAAAKTKRYALSRIRRMILCAALGVRRGDADGAPPYIRVLAMDEKGAGLLKTMRRSASVPVIVKSAHINRCDQRAKEVFELTGRAHDLYVLGYGSIEHHAALEDWRSSPFVTEETQNGKNMNLL